MVREGGAANPITEHTPEIVSPRPLSRFVPSCLFQTSKHHVPCFATKRLINHAFLACINSYGRKYFVSEDLKQHFQVESPLCKPLDNRTPTEQHGGE